MPRRRLLSLASALLILGAACSDDAPSAREPTATMVAAVATAPPSGAVTIDVRYPGGVLRAEVADDVDERARGLCCRNVLASDGGMLFDLGDVRVPSFWMKDTRIALDMIWIDDARRVVSVTAGVQPEPGVADADLSRYSPDVPVRYVLEVNAGSAARLGIAAGTQLEFTLE